MAKSTIKKGSELCGVTLACICESSSVECMKWFIFFSDDKFIIVKLMKMDSSECFISLTDLALALVFLF